MLPVYNVQKDSFYSLIFEFSKESWKYYNISITN